MIFLVIFRSCSLSTCTTQVSLCALICLTIFSIRLFSSLFVFCSWFHLVELWTQNNFLISSFRMPTAYFQFVSENREYGRGDPLRWPRDSIYRQT
jgi:hypothetical protein